MYEGSNPIAIRSQERLTNAIVCLLAEKSYSKINVKDICTRADLSRQTFYQLFTSKEDIIRYYIKQHFFVIKELSKNKDIEYTTSRFVENISQNKDFVRLLSQNDLGYVLSEEISLALKIRMDQLNVWNRPQVRKLMVAFLSAALTNLLLVWSMEDSATEQDLMVLIRNIFTSEQFKSIENNRKVQ